MKELKNFISYRVLVMLTFTFTMELDHKKMSCVSVFQITETKFMYTL
jgi:hypothetical protein